MSASDNVPGRVNLSFMDGSVLYRKIGRVPDILAGILGVVLTLLFIELAWIRLAWWMAPVGGIIGFVVGEIFAAYAAFYMKRQRFWLWLRDKFDTWEDMQRWAKETPSATINQVAGLEGDDWERWEPERIAR